MIDTKPGQESRRSCQPGVFRWLRLSGVGLVLARSLYAEPLDTITGRQIALGKNYSAIFFRPTAPCVRRFRWMGRRTNPMNELDLFAAAIAIADPSLRAALLERECAGRPDVRNRLDQLLAAHFKYQPAPGLAGTECHHAPRQRRLRDRSTSRGRRVAGHGHLGAVQAPPANRRRGHGFGLDGRPDRAGQAPGRRQADPRRTRTVQDHPVAVRGRAAGDRASWITPISPSCSTPARPPTGRPSS